MQPGPILEVRDLVKNYRSVQAVKGVSFAIPRGSCFGLLGPNGAGKTTTIEIIEGVTPATSGQVLFEGGAVDRKFKERMGIQFQHTALPDYLTGREVLRLFASFYPRTVQLAELSRLCALEEFLDRDVHKVSGGQRQRLLLALGLVNDPDIVFLDEPTTGLDPQARRNFWALIQTIKARGKTVVLTTHYMEEAYVLCDEIAIMDHGRIIAQGRPDRLLKEHFSGVVIELPRAACPLPLEKIPWRASDRTQEGGEALLQIQAEHVNDVVRFLLQEGVNLDRARIRERTLEDLFLALTGRELREES